jgi:hypothetical protein
MKVSLVELYLDYIIRLSLFLCFNRPVSAFTNAGTCSNKLIKIKLCFLSAVHTSQLDVTVKKEHAWFFVSFEVIPTFFRPWIRGKKIIVVCLGRYNCCIVSHICTGITYLLSYVMSRGSGDWFKSHCMDMLLTFHFNYHQGSFLSFSFIWVSWQEVSDDFEQRVKTLWKSLLFHVVDGQTKSNETYRECVCVCI